MRLPRLCATAALLAACRAENLVSIPGTPDRTVFVAVGQELEIMLQTIGPGEYASPPTISSGALRFLDVIMVTPAVPAGPTQRFRFRAEAPGQAVVTFHPTGQSPAVEDTVNVR